MNMLKATPDGRKQIDWMAVAGHVISVASMMVMVAYSYGKLEASMTEKIHALESRLSAETQARTELKNDLKDDLRDVKRALERIDDRLQVQQQAKR